MMNTETANKAPDAPTNGIRDTKGLSLNPYYAPITPNASQPLLSIFYEKVEKSVPSVLGIYDVCASAVWEFLKDCCFGCHSPAEGMEDTDKLPDLVAELLYSCAGLDSKENPAQKELILSDYGWDLKRRVNDDVYDFPPEGVFIFACGAVVYFHHEIGRGDICLLKVLYPESKRNDLSVRTLLNKLANDFPAKINPKPGIQLVCRSQSGTFYTVRRDIKKVNLNIPLYYGDEYAELHTKIMSRLSAPKDKGMVIFHGPPGTGKTNLLQQIISELAGKKEVLLISPDMAGILTEPSFLEFFREQENKVVIIEDAENVLKKRAAGGSQAVSNLLNLSDGILGEMMGLQFICTMNADLASIDPALLRKGRLIARYRFDALPPEKVRQISDAHGLDLNPTGPMTLAEIFNSEEEPDQTETTNIGFRKSH